VRYPPHLTTKEITMQRNQCGIYTVGTSIVVVCRDRDGTYRGETGFEEEEQAAAAQAWGAGKETNLVEWSHLALTPEAAEYVTGTYPPLFLEG
jgi:hypothetical protein